ncbi:MAG: hypothetical protein JOZ25_12115 [Actinobacteria bacterium]|nr:hypothetical protein [Actinomycetota bacterium]
MSEELAARDAYEVLDPLAQGEARRIISQALSAAGLSERERYGIEWRLRRRRAKFFLELFEIETQTVLSETAVAGRARVDRAGERAKAAVHAERLRCVGAAGRALDDGLAESARIADEDARELTRVTMLAASQGYAQGVIRRASEGR